MAGSKEEFSISGHEVFTVRDMGEAGLRLFIGYRLLKTSKA